MVNGQIEISSTCWGGHVIITDHMTWADHVTGHMTSTDTLKLLQVHHTDNYKERCTKDSDLRVFIRPIAIFPLGIE